MSISRASIIPTFLVAIACQGPIAMAQNPPRLERAPEEVANSGRLGRTVPDDITVGRAIKVSARLVGTPSPGLKVTLDGSATTGGRPWFRWLQTQGPKVTIDDVTKAEAHFTIPIDARRLEFVLVAGDSTGVDAKAVLVDVDDPEREADESAMKADAGDDQSAKVGRRVLLNGTRSVPTGKLRYRWVQAGGPKVTLKAGDGPTTSFVPAMPGTYQFALIVATAGGALSEPSTVTVTVAGNARASADADASPMAIDELARVSVASIEGGPRYADDLSKVFDKVADQVESFKTYLDAATEISRRLDAVIPREKDRRAVWIDQFFAPLMAKLGVGLKLEGLDITQPEAQRKPLTKPQKARLAEQFRFTAAGLRATKTIR